MADDAPAALNVESLDAGYPGGVRALHQIHLRVARGEVLAVLGANGAGKTTLLRSVAGVLRPQAGHVTVLGESRPDKHIHRTARAGLAYVPDDRALFPELTVGEHLRLARGVDRGLVFEAFPALAKLRNRRAGLLSGGEQQMLALARALGAQPKMLLVDEMSLGLAPLVIEQIFAVTSRLVRELGCTAVLVEQHVDRVLEFVDRAVVLAQGSIVLDLPAADARNNRDALADAYLGTAEVNSPSRAASA